MTEDDKLLAVSISQNDQSRANFTEWLGHLRGSPTAFDGLHRYINNGTQSDDLYLSIVCRMARMLWCEVLADQLRAAMDDEKDE